MSIYAVRPSSSVFSGLASANVLSFGDGFEVVRIYARTDSAKVVDVKF